MIADPRIDAYIAQAAPFAQPILAHLRRLTHRALPGAAETIKWGMPHFTLAGKNVAGMAAFKAHAAFTIHGDRAAAGVAAEAMGQLGRLTALTDLPPDAALIARLHAARDRIATGGSATRRPAARPPRAAIVPPADLIAALAANPAARARFETFAPSHRREYCEWIEDAKRPETRARRIAQAVIWLAEGKRRNWKYEAC